ncbi:MAG TPA: glycoside hydrolase family 2 TIM barrel-domain containing protein, partial [Verrucomicrobiae bacterium]|nr:glycoside hydrolase family 2 TIM barrel-domain containing protein [Verrucomicrobiae bacterium]
MKHALLLSDSIKKRGLEWRKFLCLTIVLCVVAGSPLRAAESAATSPRERISIDDGWRFTKGDPTNNTVSMLYDARPVSRGEDQRARLAEATSDAAQLSATTNLLLKPWILPTGNPFIEGPAKRFVRPDGNPGGEVSYVQGNFDDSGWQKVNLPHDWAIEGPFTHSGGGGMGRLPTAGVGWYRKKLDIPASDAGKSIFLDVDGAMSYAAVWLNGQIVGGWPYGYSSWRVDLTPYVKPGGENELAIRLDSLPNSSRWYPGAGIYRNVWLVETSPVHVGHWGTYTTTPTVSSSSATVNLKVTVDNDSKQNTKVSVATEIFALGEDGRRSGKAVAQIAPVNLEISSGQSSVVDGSTTVTNPKLWGPPPTQKPNRYVAVTTVSQGGKVVDDYETPFGFRTLKFDPNEGFFINGKHVHINGVCDHHDLGALGAAFNTRAAQRQLEILQEMGCNALRTSHNPPAPELLELCDKMGFLVMDEAFDCWQRQKTPNDYHLLFADWHEQDLRAQLRRDRNHPSVIMWSIGNEVGEQSSPQGGII